MQTSHEFAETITLDAASGAETVRTAIPQCEFGIGAQVLSTDAPRIAGVEIAAVAVWPDDRGYFLEVARLGQGLTGGFPPETTQVSSTVSYRGTIKAFHYHLFQHDCWVPTGGMLQVALVDLRVNSPTFGAKNTLYVGVQRPWQLRIPPGVAHGYKVIGTTSASLVYVTSRFYNPADEHRLAWNHPGLNYDWNLQHK